eukprot:g544.t1
MAEMASTDTDMVITATTGSFRSDEKRTASSSSRQRSKSLEGSFVMPSGRRLSRVDSRTLRESFRKNTKAVSKKEVEQILRNLDRKDNKIRYNRRLRMVLVAALGLLAVLVGAMFVVTFAANEASKESHVVKGNNLVGLDKKPVRVQELLSYSKLFDLPNFDIATLSQVKELTLSHKNQNGKRTSAVYTIVKVEKEDGSKVVKFYTATGYDLITVDSNSMVAMVKTTGQPARFVDPVNDPVAAAATPGRRLVDGDNAGANDERPRLYHADEFFTVANSFTKHGSRRLAPDSTMGGFAAVALAVTQEVLDAFNTDYGTSHTKVGLDGEFSYTGSIASNTSGFSGSVQVWIDTKSQDWAIARREKGADKQDIIYMGDDALMFAYEGTKLVKCSTIPMKTNLTAMASQLDEELATDVQPFTKVAADLTGADFVANIGEDGEYYSGTAKFGIEAKDFIKLPSSAECAALNPQVPSFSTTSDGEGTTVPVTADGTFDASIAPAKPNSRRLEGFREEMWQRGQSAADEDQRRDEAFHLGGNRQLWGSATAASSVEMWWASHAGYDDSKKLAEGTSSGRWNSWLSCSNGNAHARFFYKCDHRGCNMNLAFAGSDDVMDWLQNFNFIPGGPGGKYHRGFYDYQNGLSGCVNMYRGLLERWGIKLDYIVGHSLGGAAATVYSQEHGESLKGVVTHAAPKTNQIWGGAGIKGWRFAHADDPVPSNMCFVGCALKSHQHVVQNAYEYYDKLECWNERVASRERQQRKKCEKKWWKFWCWFEWIWVTVYEWVRSCDWRKKISGRSRNFAHNFWSWVSVVYGGLAKHNAYGGYPSINL